MAELLADKAKVSGEQDKVMRILIAGASGFIGTRLVKSLSQFNAAGAKIEIICLSRRPQSASGINGKNVKTIKCDVTNYDELLNAMSGIDVAYYLVHSMEGSSKEWKRFSERDRLAAENFAKASSVCGVKRIIYLSGLTHVKDEELSEHMRSRKEVGEILRGSTAEVTIFCAAVILGQGGGSFKMLQYLVERLPIMVCPKWVMTKCQPIAVGDVVEYLTKALTEKRTVGKTFDIGGPDVLTYLEMIHRYGAMKNKKVRVIIIPFLTPRLSSYWIDLVTPVEASLARPLIDSLVHDAIVKEDESVKKIIPLRLNTFEQSIEDTLEEETLFKRPAKEMKARTSKKLNERVLLVSLFLLAAIGSSYYFLDGRAEIFQAPWIMLSIIWFFGIAVAIYFVGYGTRLGALVSGILGWVTLAFWLLDNFYVVFGSSLIANSPNLLMTGRNFLGAVIAGLVITFAHNAFHKIRT
jgi:uncharacterized protein YbjT (DUF2867 family)